MYFNTSMEDLMHDLYILSFWGDDQAIFRGVFRSLADILLKSPLVDTK
jgi:hypothetical protein